MKTKHLIFAIILLFSMQVFAQEKKNTVYLTPKELVGGAWQRGDSIVGAGLGQYFIFYKNGSFELNLSDDDDARDIIRLKGKYRLVQDSLYFTVISRTVVKGEFEVGAIGSDFAIFYINDYDKFEEIPEKNPQELEPCYVTVFDKKHIKINNEEYYKVDEKYIDSDN